MLSLIVLLVLVLLEQDSLKMLRRLKISLSDIAVTMPELLFLLLKRGWSVCVCVQLCLTLYKPIDCSLPESSVHGILQARILESVAILFRGFS